MKRTFPMFLLAVVVLSGCNRSVPPGQAPQPATTGEINIQAIDATEVAQVVEKHRGKVVLVDFWATWCPPCREAFPHTVDLHRRLADQGLEVITVSFDDMERKELALDFLTKQGATTENFIVRDAGSGQTAEVLRVEGYPSYKLYDRQGKERRTFLGGGHETEIASAVEALLKEK